MKSNKNTILWSFVALVALAALYRLIPGRPYGFAPQLAMAVFAGAVIADKRIAFLLPVLSMFLSDVLYEMLYRAGQSEMAGFYEGQWQNYLLIAAMVVVGFFARSLRAGRVLLACLAAPVFYFLLSNFVTWAGWAGTRGLGRPRTFSGLLMAYNDGLPFFRMSLIGTLVFGALLFGGYALLGKMAARSGKVVRS